MATFSDGGDVFTGNMRSGSPSSTHSSAGDMRFYLQTLLDNKEKQLQQAGTLGQQLLAQRMELEERIRQLQDFDLETFEDESAEASIRGKYRDLAETIKGWDVENEQLSGVFTAKSTNGSQASPTSHSLELSRNDLERSLERSKAAASGTTAAQSSRRAKNAAHRADDVEFAFEIGSGLLTEVRRLQSLLGERDKAIQDMKEEKDDMEKTIESLREAVRTQEQSADKYREENWNLEVTLQELRAQLSDSQVTTQRLEGEQKRLTKLLTVARETADQHKNDSERHQSAFEELKAKHETDVAQARKHAASLQRDKSDLQQTLDTMKAEMAKATRRLPRFGSPLTPNGPTASQLATPNEMDEDDVFSMALSTNNKRRGDTSAIFPLDDPDFADLSPDPSPSKPFLSPNHPTNEIEALQQRLAHAQRQINTLKGTVQREKELRIEYRRKLDASPGYVGEEDVEEDFVDEQVENARPKERATPYRSGGRSRRGRGRGGLSLLQRFNLANQSPSSEYPEDEERRDTSPPPPVPPMPKFLDGMEDEEHDEEEEEPNLQNSPSPAVDTKRTSVEGMDPMFANILRRSASASSLPINASPLRQSAVSKYARGNTLPRRSRGGAAYQEARPLSLIGQPEALAAELGLGMMPTMEDTIEVPEIETAEFGCQTDFEEPPAPLVVVEISPPSPPTPAPIMSEIAIQVDPEPVLVIVRSDASQQTDVEPEVPRSTIGVQHNYSEPKPVLVTVGMATEPEPMPTFAQAEVQTPRALMFNVDTQTMPESLPIPVQKADIDVQTIDSSSSTADTETQTPAIHVSGDDDATVSYGSLNVDNTFTPRPAPLMVYEEDDGTQTETGSYLETDMEDYQDARQSISLTTPTESLEDYHSILTVTDNDFSDTDDDEESIKAARIANRQGGSAMSSTFSIPLVPSPTPPPVPTYESVGISTDPIEELAPVPEPKVEPPPLIPEPPKADVKEMSVQTDYWSPPLPPVSTPSTPALAPSPTLFRVGPSSQQFQFISAPPSASPTTASLPIVASPSPNLRDSIPTFMSRPRSTLSDRKVSMESTFATAVEDMVVRTRTPSNVPSVVDKSRPPMMILPPPPRQPPPPNTMLPPPFIPERRFPTTSTTSSRDVPPPRPSSPPPPELIQRATTPTFGAVLNVPGGRPFGLRQHGSSMPPSQAGLRQPPSTSSFRSAANAATRAQQASPSFNIRGHERREMSTTSLNSNVHSVESQRSSISSENQAFDHPSTRLSGAPETPNKALQTAGRQVGGSTDPTVIHAITQTMIGEFLYKYTRRAIGKGHGERRHKRFFWVHPYTRTLYWSSADPGSSGVSESSAKSAYIESVRAVLDPNPMPPGIHQYSVVVSTPQREMKFTAPTKERHEIWLDALQFLLSRPGPGQAMSPGNSAMLPNSPISPEARLPEADPMSHAGLFASPQSQRSTRTTRTGFSSEWNITPRGQKNQSQISLGGSMSKRSGTPAAEYLRWNGPDAPNSPTKSFEHIHEQDDADYDFELHNDTLSDEGFEGLENVRACCDGRHTVGRSGKIEHHHHHHHDSNDQNSGQQSDPPRRSQQLLEVNASEVVRPASPAWSFRSRAGSGTSHDRDGGFFARFGSRRSTKTTPVVSAMQVHDR